MDSLPPKKRPEAWQSGAATVLILMLIAYLVSQGH